MRRRDVLAGAVALGCVPQALGGIGASEAIMKIVDSNGAQIATEARGEPTRGTILLAMGSTASMVWWPDSLIEALSVAGYLVIRFDHRDTGQSTTNAPGDVQYDVSDLAEDLMAILDAYGVRAAHLVGMSLGGYVAQIASLIHDDRALSLTLIASEPVGIAYEGEGIAEEFMEHFGAMADLDWTNHDAVAEFMLGIAELSAGSFAPFDREAAMKRIELELSRSESIQSAFNHSMVGGDLDPRLTAHSLDLPVLVIHGSEDPIISLAAAHATADAVTNSKLLMLNGRGHELLEQDVPEIASAILRLCSEAAA